MTLYIGGEILHTTRIANYLEKNWANLLYFGVLFFTSCCFYENYNCLLFFSCPYCRVLKILISFIVPFCATICYYVRRKNLIFVGDISAFIMILFSILFLLDYSTFKIMWQTVGTTTIFHPAYCVLTFFGVYLGALLVTKHNQKNGKCNNHFNQMDSAFWIGALCFTTVTLLMVFIFTRKFFSDRYILNLIPTQGAMKNIVIKRNFSEIVRNFGNVGLFSILSISICQISKSKNKNALAIIIPILISISMEIFQYIFSCGDADVDDILFNIIGTVIGVLIYKNIILKIKEKEI